VRQADSPARLVVVVAHPDDEVLGCGGLIANHAAHGLGVHVVCVADGVTSRHGATEVDAERREQECLRALRVLIGLPGRVTFLRHADQRLGTMPVAVLADRIRYEIDQHGPSVQTVVTHWIGDLNQDHRVVAEATLLALRPDRVPQDLAIYGCEVPETTRIGAQAFCPTTYVELSPAIQTRKELAMQEYGSEVRSDGFRNQRGIQAASLARGYESGRQFAEAYVLYRSVEGVQP